MKDKRIFTQTRLEALVILSALAGYIWESFSIPAFYSLPGVPGPNVFPIIIGSTMAAAALWIMIFPGEQAKEQKTGAAADRRRGFADRWQSLLMWALLIGYVIFLPRLGFIFCSAVLLAVFFFLLGERRWYRGIIVALVFSISIYYLFAKALQINLPMGILEIFLRP